MPRSRPATDPVSFHKPTGQYYVTRGGKRRYLGADHDEAIKAFHRLALDRPIEPPPPRYAPISAKQLANRFLATQCANWRSRENTMKSYRGWLARFLQDHPSLVAEDLTVERFAAWKLSLIDRGYSGESINHYMGAVRAMYRFAEDVGLIERVPKLARVKNASRLKSEAKPIYSPEQVRQLLDAADLHMRAMILLALNCGFGPKDLRDLRWSSFDRDRVTLVRSKTGIGQTFMLWPETLQAVQAVRKEREALITRLAKRGRQRTDNGYFLVTKYWRPWDKNTIGGEFRKLCKEAGVRSFGFYRLRHCASTAMSLVATPHVHRKFMRHSQIQQQVTYTHTPDAEVDTAVMRARGKLLHGTEENETISEDAESDPQQAGAA